MIVIMSFFKNNKDSFLFRNLIEQIGELIVFYDVCINLLKIKSV